MILREMSGEDGPFVQATPQARERMPIVKRLCFFIMPAVLPCRARESKPFSFQSPKGMSSTSTPQ